MESFFSGYIIGDLHKFNNRCSMTNYEIHFVRVRFVIIDIVTGSISPA